jgi:hypothetical protein
MSDGVSDPYFPTESLSVDPAKWEHFAEEILAKAQDYEEIEDDPKDENTAGQENPHIPGREELAAKLSRLKDGSVSAEDKASALLWWLLFWSKGNHDDRTILIAADIPSSKNNGIAELVNMSVNKAEE